MNNERSSGTCTAMQGPAQKTEVGTSTESIDNPTEKAIQRLGHRVLILDIETIPNMDLMEEERKIAIGKGPKVGNLKDPVKIAQKEAAFAEDVENKLVSDMSLNPFTGQVFCCAFANLYKRKVTILSQTILSEAQILERIAIEIRGAKHISGYNIRQFDLWFLNVRSMLVRGKPILKEHETRSIVFDVMDLAIPRFSKFPPKVISNKKEDVARRMGIKLPEGATTGSQVYDMYINGNQDQINQHCIEDVEVELEMLEKLGGIHALIHS